jgi:hypothetical protein
MQMGRPVSFGLGGSDRPLSGHVTASLLRDDGTGAISALFEAPTGAGASDMAGFPVGGSSRLVRCGDVLSQSERQAVYHRLSSLHGEVAAWNALLCQCTPLQEVSSAAAVVAASTANVIDALDRSMGSRGGEGWQEEEPEEKTMVE